MAVPHGIDRSGAAGGTGSPGMIGSLNDLADPGADRIVFWDDSVNDLAWLELSNALVITGTVLSLDTAGSPQVTALNVGHATDTTISRASAGDIQVEANIVYRAGGTDVSVTDGGTGSSTAAAAAAALSVLPLSGGTLTGAVTLADGARAAGRLGLLAVYNAGFAATVLSNAITIALKGQDGNDPSATNTVRVPFRSATLTTGTPVVREVTAALSLVISAGSTLGFTASETSRIRIGFIDNAGTVELCAWKPVVGTAPSLSIFSPSEDSLVSTTAEGGAGGADTAGVLYSTTARTSVAFRHAGFIDIQTGTTAGNWSNAPAKIQTHGPGVRLPGDVVQNAYTQTGAVATGTTTIPTDDTIPQSTEGDQYLSQVITPTDAENLLRIRAFGELGNSVPGRMTLALFQDAVAGALAANSDVNDNAGAPYPVFLTHVMVAATVASTTFKIRGGGNSPGTTTLNGDLGARTLGGVRSSNLGIEEIMV